MTCGIMPIVFRATKIIAMSSGEDLDTKRASLRITTWYPTVLLSEPGDD